VTLGNSIKIIRTARGITQRDLAKKLKISANYLSLVESDKREPSLSFLTKLAKALNVPMKMFFMWEGEPMAGANASDLDQLRALLIRMETLLPAPKERARGKKQSAA
jgi:transcriptional regulator with XRE-family HTH domain